MRHLDPRDVHRLAGETGADPRTVRRWLKDPNSVVAAVAYALEAARKSLGIEFNLPKTG